MLIFQSVFNAQLVPENTDLITDIMFPKDGDNQVFIPANAIRYQRTVEEGTIIYVIMLCCICFNVLLI